MTKQRLTRAERSAQTRAELMASARQLFLRRGFHAASLELVAEEAGFTIGAVYSRFGSKADLFLAILDERIDQIVAEVAQVARLDQPIPAHAELLAGRRMALLDREREWFPLVLEFWSHAARDERLRREFSARHERLVGAYAGLIEADYARLGLPLPLAPEVLARAVVAMGNGVALERLANPDRVPEGLLSTMAVSFLRGAAADGAATERRS
ncbi:MAG TPA: TetR/AcrR family transcriptional regulator [Actinomycetota bacterium]|jgi:AcrR family transcriptional regulator|nr:TetR/AcrR family transcriptional regulator [Actinomycetota bacterium]